MVSRIQQSSFIAKVHFTKVAKASPDNEYQKAEIEILELYKGEKIKSINIHSYLQLNCAMIVPENSTWLIFASYGKTGELEFGACSGSKQMDEKINDIKYPGLEEKIKKSLAIKIDVLKFLNKYKIDKTNPLNANIGGLLNESFKGFDVNGDGFAVYQISIENEKSVIQVKPLKEFSNKELSGKLLEVLSKLEIKNANKIQLPITSTIVFYYYPEEAGNKSFISLLDL